MHNFWGRTIFIQNVIMMRNNSLLLCNVIKTSGTLHTAYCTLHAENWTVNNSHCTLYTEHWTLQITHYIMYTAHCTLYTRHFWDHAKSGNTNVAAAARRVQSRPLEESRDTQTNKQTKPVLAWKLGITQLTTETEMKLQLGCGCKQPKQYRGDRAHQSADTGHGQDTPGQDDQ